MIGLTLRDPLRSLFDITEMVPRNLYIVDENNDDITLSTDLPGIKAEDVRVSIENGTISVRAQRKERNYFYSWTVPKTVDVEKIEANYEDGVLTLTLPKLETSKLRQIPIKVNNNKELAASAVA